MEENFREYITDKGLYIWNMQRTSKNSTKKKREGGKNLSGHFTKTNICMINKQEGKVINIINNEGNAE